MGSFSASLRTIGDRRGLPATVTIDSGRITIEAGDHPIGDWSLDEVHLEPTGNGYRMAAEGEQILLEVQDAESFEIELRTIRKRPRIRPARKGREREPSRSRAEKPKPEPNRQPRRETPPRRVEEPKPKPSQTVEVTPRSGGVMGRVDAVISAAERKWGSLLPPWVFTRRVVWACLAVVAATVVFPGIISSLLLFTGLILVLAGAVVYTDSVMAAKWLPGRMTPMHVLIAGVAVVMLGVLVGVVA